METYTASEAVTELERLAEAAENENYHTEASVLWEASDLVAFTTMRTLVIVPAAYGGITKFIVVPDI